MASFIKQDNIAILVKNLIMAANGTRSEKIVALADLYEFGYTVFEDKLNFKRWIQTPNKALGSRKPLELLDTISGIEEVKNIIGRIAHGVYS